MILGDLESSLSLEDREVECLHIFQEISFENDFLFLGDVLTAVLVPVLDKELLQLGRVREIAGEGRTGAAWRYEEVTPRCVVLAFKGMPQDLANLRPCIGRVKSVIVVLAL